MRTSFRNPIGLSFLSSFAALMLFAAYAFAAPPQFVEQTIDDNVQIGYGTAIGDVDGDGKPDILLADKRQFVWYRNPDWKRFVMVNGLTPLDNVCIAARDIDGDGKVEVAVGAQWNPGDTENSGSVHYLQPPQDRTKPWRPIQLHHEPVIHRMRWVKSEDGYVLVVAPLHGRGNQGGKGAGVKLLAYSRPRNVEDEWKTTLLDDTMHVTHNFDFGQWDPTTPGEEVLYLGREGGMLISHSKDGWRKKRFDRVQGGGEIRMGLHGTNQPFLVTIESFHGDKLVYYRSAYDRRGKGDRTKLSDRIVLDSNFKQGHAIAVADLFGNGQQQVVAGWRQKNSDGKVGVKLYYPTDKSAQNWASLVIDDNTMATEDLRIGDLNDDGRPDIVAAGRSTHNLKVYWNRKP